MINFIPERLKEAREIRGYTQTELAQLLGISRQAMSQFENSMAVPSAKTLAELALVLRVPVRYFTTERPRTTRRTSPIFFRKLDSTIKKARKIAEGYEQWFADIIDVISNYLDFPKPNIPIIETDFRNLTDDDIEQIALDVRTHWNLGKGAISNLALLLQNNGILIARISLSDGIDSFSCWRETKPIIALVSNNKTSVRSRFNAAHELAHLVLHRYVQNEDLENKSVHSLIEKQAHRFASAFLMPAESFSKDFIAPSLPILENMKKKWLVSIAAMVMRGADLGFINENQKSNIFRQLSARGYRTKEPLDDDLIPEKPVLLERAIKILIDEKLFSIDELLDAVLFPVNDLKELASMDRALLDFNDNVVGIDFKKIT